jgi:hypothetical protein
MSSITSNNSVFPGLTLPHLAITAVLVFVFSFFALVVSMAPDISAIDEGLILTGAMQVGAGAIPHRDFYSLYGPGQFYVVAGLFDLFGQTVLVERLYDVAVKASIVCFLYLVASQLMRPLYAAIAAALCLLWIAAEARYFPAYPVWPCLLLILLSIWIALPLFSGRYSIARLVSVGVCVWGVVLFRYDLGVLALIIFSAAFVLFGLRGPQTYGSRARQLATILAPFWVTVGFLFTLLISIYMKLGIINDFIFQVVTYPSLHYVDRRLPFLTPSRSNLYDMIIYMPILTVIAFVTLMLTNFSELVLSKGGRREVWMSSVIACFATGLYFKGVVRVSVIHLMASITVSFIVLGYVVDRFMSRPRMFGRAALALPLLAAVLFAFVPSLVAAKHVVRGNLRDAINLAERLISKKETAGDDRCNSESDLSPVRCFRLSAPEVETIRYVVGHSAPDQPILVASGINDKIFANNMALYFLTGRHPATKWAQFDPGLQNSEPIQAEMVGELESRQAPLVVLDAEWDNVNEPNGSAKHSGVTILDDYIHQHYKEVARFDPYLILQR